VDYGDKVKATCAYCRYVARTYVLLKMPKLTKIMLLTGLSLLLLGLLLSILVKASLVGDVILSISVASILFSMLNLLRTRT